MKVTGNKLRASIKFWEMKQQVAVQVFETSTHAFTGDNKDPVGAMTELEKVHRNIAALQDIQSVYNQQVTVKVGEEQFSLCRAVKLIGMVGQSAKLWRSALPKKERYSYNRELVREADQEVAKPVISYEDMTDRAFKAQKYANDLQAAIATGNAVEIELDVPEGLII